MSLYPNNTSISNHYRSHFLGILLLFFVCGLTCSKLQAQNETTKWYFGAQAGLDFMTNPPTILTNGAMTTQEGCASIANAAGNLLFYTDGITVWNSSHVAMANGTGLMGNGSSTQSGVIVKLPGSSTLYYVFTLDAVGGVNGLRYSIVDMTLASGSGSVTTKNVLLQTPSTEKLTAVKHCNGTDIWIVSHDLNSNNFRTWLLTSAGITGAPVISTAGPTHNNMLGNMKASPNGRKLGLAVYTTNNSFEIYDFDNTTGVVSNGIVLGNNYTLPYGIEFSPDGRVFYGCNATASNSGTIYQWNLCASSSSAIIASQQTIASTSQAYGSMQLANNGKIYVARYMASTVGVIHNPNNLGTSCNYVDLGQSISPKVCRFGLPNFVTSFLKGPPTPFTYTFNAAVSCLNASFTAPPSQTCGSAGYTTSSVAWNFGDPASGAGNVSALANPTHSFSAPGTYTTQLILYYTCGSDTLRQTVSLPQPTMAVGSSPVNCAAPGSATIFAGGAFGSFTYSWIPSGQTSSVATNLSAGTHTVWVNGSGSGCNFSTTAVVATFNSFSLSVFASTPTCNGANTATAGVVTNGGSSSFSYSWTGTSQSTPTVTGLGSGNYTVYVTDQISLCTLSKTFAIIQPPALTVNIAAGSPSACVGNSIQLSGLASGGTGVYSYSWSTTQTTQSIVINQNLAGNYPYTLTVTDSNNCTQQQDSSFNYVPIPTVSAANQTICLNTTATLAASGASNYTWSPGNTNGITYTTSPTAFSTYTVLGEAAACIGSTTVSVDIKPYPTFAFNNASITCGSLGSGTIITSGGIGPFTYFWAPAALTGSAVYGLFPGTQNVTVNDLGTNCTYTATTYFAPLVPLTGTVTSTPSNVCNGVNTGSASIALSGGSGTQTYTWTNGSVISTAASPTTLGAGINTVIVEDLVTYCSVTHTFLITQPPALTLSLVQSSPSVCLGSSINLSGTSSGGTSPYTYTWTNYPPGSAITVSEPVAAQYNYSLISTDANACTITAIAPASFVGNPTVTVNSTSICPLAIAALSATGATTYTWQTGSNNSSIFVSPPSGATYSVVGNSLGCTDTAIASVFLYPAPQPTLSTNSPLCQGENILLNIGGGQTYFWSGPAGFTATAASNTINNAVPGLSGVYSVTLTSVEGCTAFASNPVTVHPTPLLVVAGSTVCEGNTLIVTANYLSGGTYQWNGPAFTGTTQNASISNAQISNTGTYTVILTSAAGCTNQAQANASVAVAPQPIITGDSIICKDDTLILYGSGNGTYSWYGPANFHSLNQNAYIYPAKISQTGTYTLQVTSGPCVISTTKSVTVYNAATPTLIAPSVICEHVPVFLSGLGGVTYTWTGPSGFSSNLQNTNIADPEMKNAGNYTLAINDIHGCYNYTSSLVNILPAPQLTMVDATVCIGSPFNFTNTSNGTGTWTGPQNFTANMGQAFIAAVNQGNIGSYSLTVVASNSCSTTGTMLLNGVNLPLPEPKITGSTKACLGGTMQLNGSGGITYQWFGPNSYTANVPQINLPVKHYSISGIYTLAVTNESFCVATATIPVKVYDLPVAIIINSAPEACVPFCSNITVREPDSAAAFKDIRFLYDGKWYNTAPLKLCFDKAGSYPVNINYTDTNGCSNSSTTTVISHLAPEARFSFSPASPFAGVDKVYFYDNSRGDNLKDWHWILSENDSIVISEKNPVKMYAQPGTFPAVLVVKNVWGCADTIIQVINVLDELNIFVPNSFTPNGDGINDVFMPKGEGVTAYQLKIYNRWGEEIFTSNDFYSGWNGEYKGESCKQDTYTWTIRLQAGTVQEKRLTGNVNLIR